MTNNRKACLRTLINTGLNVILITPNNINDYLKEPLHEGFKYLSDTHKADYLRTYFTHFLGGAYSDIKFIANNWIPYVDKINNDDKIWICGYAEIEEGHVANVIDDPEVNREIHKNWQKMIGNGGYICKPNTPLTKEWYGKMIEVMDSNLEKLKLFPAQHPQDQVSENSKYPLRWAQLLGEIFHPLILKYNDHVDKTLPRFIPTPYR